MNLYVQDQRTDTGLWKGLLLTVSRPEKPLLRLRTAHGGHMKLSAGEQDLLWAEIDPDYCGVEVWRVLPGSSEVALLPRIRAADLERSASLQGEAWQSYWAGYFVRTLHDAPWSPLYSGLWALEFHELAHRYDSPRWLGRNRWPSAITEDQAFWAAHRLYVDWGCCGNGSIIPLLMPHEDPEQAGRIKWWRKVAQGQNLPPILIWFIGALDAYVILDGHDRLQAALLSGVTPAILVACSCKERVSQLDEKLQRAVLNQLAIIQQKMDEGTLVSPSAFTAVQQALVSAFDDRPVRTTATTGYADISADQWRQEVQKFEQCLRMAKGDAALEPFVIDD